MSVLLDHGSSMGTSLGGAPQPLLPVPAVDEEPQAVHVNEAIPPSQPSPHLCPKNKPSKDGRVVWARGPAPGTGGDRFVPIPASAGRHGQHGCSKGVCRTGIREGMERMSPA